MTSISLTNMVTNGNFESAITTGWSIYGTSTEVINEQTSSYHPFGSYGFHSYKPAVLSGGLTQSLSVVTGHKYYITGYGYSTYVSDYNYGYVGFVGALAHFSSSSGRTSSIYTASSTESKTLFLTIATVGDPFTPQHLYCDGVMVIDLTASFGSGLEPPVAVMDQMIVDNGGFWDGTESVDYVYPTGTAEFENLIINGSFESALTTGWTTVTGTATREATHPEFGSYDVKVLSYYVDGASYARQAVATTSGHKYYIAAYGMCDSTGGDTGLLAGSTLLLTYNISTMTRNSAIYTATSSSTNITIKSDCTAPAVYRTLYVDGVMVIDLTAAFGSGYEPTAAFMDGIIERRMSGWFDTDYLKCYTSSESLLFENNTNNGSFESDLSGWTNQNASILTSAPVPYGTKYLRLTTSSTNGIAYATQAIDTTKGHIYYTTFKGKKTSGITTARVSFGTSSADISSTSGWERYGCLYTSTSTGTKTLQCYGEYLTDTTLKYAYFDGIVVIDLTYIFGSGNEPSVADMNSFIEYFNSGWWDSGSSNVQSLDAIDFKNVALRGGYEQSDYDSYWQFSCTDGTGGASSAGSHTRLTFPNTYGSGADQIQLFSIQDQYAVRIKNTYDSGLGSGYAYTKYETDHKGMEWNYNNRLYASAICRKIIPVGSTHGTAKLHIWNESLQSSLSNVNIPSTFDRASVLYTQTAAETNVTLRFQLDSNNEDMAAGDEVIYADAIAFISVTDAFNGSSVASTITTGAMDSIIGAFGEYIPATSDTPTGLDVEDAERMSSPHTCQFQAYMSWDEVDGASYYKVYHSVDGSDYALMATSIVNEYYTAEYLTQGATHSFKVSSVSSEGGESYLSDAQSESTESNKPDTPSIYKQPAFDLNGFLSFYPIISWTCTSPLTISRYEIQRYYCATSGGTYVVDGSAVSLTTSDTTVENYADTVALVTNRYYKYKIKCVNICESYGGIGDEVTTNYLYLPPGPSPPTSTSDPLKRTSSDTPALSFEFNTGNPTSPHEITSYNIYRMVGGTPTHVGYVYCSQPETSSSDDYHGPYIDTGLVAGGSYYYKIAAISDFGEGDISAQFGPFVAGGKPNAPVIEESDIQACKDSGNVGFSVGCTTGLMNGCDIVGIRIKYSTSGQADIIQSLTFDDPLPNPYDGGDLEGTGIDKNMTTYTSASFLKNTEYTISVAIKGNLADPNDYSDFSNELTATTYGPPGPCGNFTGVPGITSGRPTVYLDWDTPEELNGSTLNPTTNYYVACTTKALRGLNPTYYNYGYLYSDEYLNYYTTYTFYVHAVSDLGDGEKTYITVETYGPPDAPVTTSGIRNGNYFNTPYIKLGWLPARSTSPVSGYNIYRSTNGVKPGTVTYTVSNGTSFNDTDILPNTTYYYWIIPYNGLGEYTE